MTTRVLEYPRVVDAMVAPGRPDSKRKLRRGISFNLTAAAAAQERLSLVAILS